MSGRWRGGGRGERVSEGALVINDGYRAKNAELEDVVFTSRGTVGRFALVREDIPRFVYSPRLCFWRSLDNDRILPRWLFYWMQSREFVEQYQAVSGQTDMAAYVNLRDQRRMAIRIPAPSEQRAMAHILGTLDDKIELNRRMSQTLEGMARALFKSWFVDFDPVRAKAEGRDPGLPKPLADLLPPEPVETTFHRMIRPSVERILAGIHESRTLAALRNALLSKLISGKLRIEDAKRFIGRTA